MPDLEAIRQAEEELTRRYRDKLVINADLDRTLVSFQANKAEPGYRWFKYKEGFSARLVEYLLERLGIRRGRLLDPFAGCGTALFAAAARGLDAVGMELLPVGGAIMEARKKALLGDRGRLAAGLARWAEERPWRKVRAKDAFPHLAITAGAFPADCETALACYVTALAEETDGAVRTLLRFAALCVLEAVSYTRKDGQYLRWDSRSGRKQGRRPFHKGALPPFDAAVTAKLAEMAADLRADPPAQVGAVEVIAGSCLERLPQLPSHSFDCLITSPPYCNRYDYTRTYALELAFLGVSAVEVKALRQTMVSCTVENREKDGLQTRFAPDLLARARRAYEGQELLSRVLKYLEARKAAGVLNNNGIPRMVRHYFWEMTLVVFECGRLLKPGAPLVMVNDNVRYEGAGVPVDLILSDIARQAGFDVETIWVLPTGKGNSSQQMGRHGRDELRKCVYVWRAPAAQPATAATSSAAPEPAAAGSHDSIARSNQNGLPQRMRPACNQRITSRSSAAGSKTISVGVPSRKCRRMPSAPRTA
jgi:DNA modification methylase